MSSSLPGPVFMSKAGKKYKDRAEKKVEHRARKAELTRPLAKRPTRTRKIFQYLLLTGGLLVAVYVAVTHLSGKSKIEKNGNWFQGGGASSGGGGGSFAGGTGTEANWDGFTRAVLRRSDALGRLANAVSKAWERANTVRDGLWAQQLRSFTAGLGQTPDKSKSGGP